MELQLQSGQSEVDKLSTAIGTSHESASSGQASAPNVAVVGATGAVGQEFLNVLADRDFPIGQLRLLASQRSAGKSQQFRGSTYTIETLTDSSFRDIDIAMFSASGAVSKRFGPIAVDAGVVVVDNSSAFRMTDGVPLVVPEVNPESIGHSGIGLGASGQPGIIANPNCSTIIMLVPVTPLHRAVGVDRMVISTYQAASGAGAAAMIELETQAREYVEGRKRLTTDIFGQQYIFNVFSHDSDIGPDGYNTEETKMVNETRKIWNAPTVRVSATCVRVPVLRAHAEAINLTFQGRLSESDALALLSAAPGVSIIDDRQANRFPTPVDASGKDDVYVGRIRADHSQEDGRGLDMFICADQIRKGAALNAVQIAELLL